MAEEQNISIRLTSHADTSGFDQFRRAQGSLTAAKYEHSRANDLIVNSERRVRTNLMDTVKGLAEAKNGTEALGSAIGHLSEVFKVGFAGVVLGGIVEVLVDQFAKAEASVKQTALGIDNLRKSMRALADEVKGVKLTPAQQQSRKFLEERQELSALEENYLMPSIGTRIGFAFADSMQMLGLGKLGANDLLRKHSEQWDQFQGMNAQFEKNFNAFNKKQEFGAESSLSTPGMKTPQEMFEAHALERQADADQEAKLKAEADAKAKSDAARKEAEDKKRSDDAAMEAAREAASEEGSGNPVTGWRVRLETKAGSQRAMGGGGGAYSTITFDPVVSKLSELNDTAKAINNSINANGRKPAVMAA